MNFEIGTLELKSFWKAKDTLMVASGQTAMETYD